MDQPFFVELDLVIADLFATLFDFAIARRHGKARAGASQRHWGLVGQKSRQSWRSRVGLTSTIIGFDLVSTIIGFACLKVLAMGAFSASFSAIAGPPSSSSSYLHYFTPPGVAAPNGVWLEGLALCTALRFLPYTTPWALASSPKG